jgi:hypothetical protein
VEYVPWVKKRYRKTVAMARRFTTRWIKNMVRMLSMMMLSMVAVEVAMFLGREDWMETMLIVVVVMVVGRGEWEVGGVWDGEESDR